MGDVERLVESLVALFRSNPNFELEGSLGVHTETGYQPGVDFSHFKLLWETFTKAEGLWSSQHEAKHFATYYYDDNVRGRYGWSPDPNFVKKTSIARVDLICPERKFGIRISVNCEEPCSQPVNAKARKVRLHERWGFAYKNNWQYDLSKVAIGTSKATACKSPITFDIELELDRSVLLDVNKTDRQLSESLLCKLLDLLGRYDSVYNKQVLTLLPYQKNARLSSHV